MTIFEDVKRERETATKIRNLDVIEVVDLVHDLQDDIARLEKIEIAARDIENTITGGFVKCSMCGRQEDLTDIDSAGALRKALDVPE